jgi:hypothetical protein
MRLTRYRQLPERQVLELALRLLRYPARNCTVQACTGLSEDQIRSLHRYQESTPTRPPRRGQLQRIDSLLADRITQQHASLLAGLYLSSGLLQALERYRYPLQLAAAERLCDVFDIHRHLHGVHLDFELAWQLWRALQPQGELQLHGCPSCGAMMLRRRYERRSRGCPWCRRKPSDTRRSQRHTPSNEPYLALRLQALPPNVF